MTIWQRFALFTILGMQLGELLGKIAAVHRWW